MDFDTLASKYVGEVAATYNQRRTLPRWDKEQAAIGELMKHGRKGIRVLDVPVGTGRVFPFYQRLEAEVTGLDISQDMLSVAAEYAAELRFDLELREGDIRSLPFGNSTFELVTCIRFLNWVDLSGVRQSFSELARVCSDQMLIGTRHKTVFRDLRPTRADAGRMLKLLRHYPEENERRKGLVYHTRLQMRRVFKEFGFEVKDFRQTDRRWDGTDYMIYLLQRSH